MWCLSSILEKDPEMADKIGFAPYPVMMEDGTPMVLVAEDSGYSISADSEHIDEAKEFPQLPLQPREPEEVFREPQARPPHSRTLTLSGPPPRFVEGVNSAVESAANIGYTNEKPAGFTGDDAGRMVQDLLAGKYTAEEFARGI